MIYYKKKGEKCYLKLKTALPEDQLAEYDEIDEATFNRETAPTKPTPTKEQIRRKEIKTEITRLKRQLADTDYEAIKFAEGEMSAEDYAPYKAQRAQWRAEINALEEELAE